MLPCLPESANLTVAPLGVDLEAWPAVLACGRARGARGAPAAEGEAEATPAAEPPEEVVRLRERDVNAGNMAAGGGGGPY